MLPRLLTFSLLALLAGSLSSAELSTKELAALLKQGGKHWSVSEVGCDGFTKYETPGDVIFLWLKDDAVIKPTIFPDGSATFATKLRWQLQPRAKLPEKFPEYLTYVWGEPDKKAYGFQVTKDLDPKTSAGEISISLTFQKQSLEKLKAEPSVVVVLLHEGKPLANFLNLKLQFPK
jgi:hypothetical protein